MSSSHEAYGQRTKLEMSLFVTHGASSPAVAMEGAYAVGGRSARWVRLQERHTAHHRLLLP
ncbi:MAG: hypothetical protein ACRDZT_08455 [Acidimicrobiales bacterium]